MSDIKLFFDRHVSGTFSGSFDGSISTAVSASFATTASFATLAALADTGSYVAGGNVDGAVALADTASYVAAGNIDGVVASASFATTASFAQTGSYVAGGDVDGAVALADTASYVAGADVDGTVALATTASFASKAAVAPIQLSLNNNFGADIVITNLTGSVEEWDSGQRTKVDLTNYSRARTIVRVNQTDVSGAVGIQYSADESSWTFLDGGEGPSASLATVGTIASDFAELVGGAQADVYVRWVTFSGSEADTAKLGSVTLLAR